MKAYAGILILFVSVSVVYSQAQGGLQRKPRIPTDNATVSPEEWRLNLVARLLSLPSPVTNGAPQLHGMGDEAAVDVLKLLAKKGVLTLPESNAALDVIHMAFEAPSSIISPINKKPQATLFLLQQLSSSADPALQQRIAKELTFVEAAGASSTSPPPSKQ